MTASTARADKSCLEILSGAVDALDEILKYDKWNGVVNVMGASRAVFIALAERVPAWLWANRKQTECC